MRTFALSLALFLLTPLTASAQLCDFGSGTGTAFAYWVDQGGDLISRHTNLATALARAQEVARSTGTAYVRAHFEVTCTLPPDTTTTPPDTTATDPPEPTEPGDGLVFEDTFESGTFAGEQNGIGWSGPNRTQVLDMMQEDGVQPVSGDFALRFRFPASDSLGDAHAEQRYRTDRDGPLYRELWFEYWLYVPDNFRLRSDASSSNNKLAQFFGYLDRFDATLEFRRSTDISARSRELSDGYAWGVRRNGLGANTCTGEASLSPLISPDGPIAIGEWTRIRFHLKAASGPDINDGSFHWWIGDELKMLNPAYNFWPETGSDNAWGGGYLMGWANTGYSEETRFWVDDFRIYSSDPGWTMEC